MQMFVLVLNRVECLESILEKLLVEGIGGATVLESTGMMRLLDAEDSDLPMFGALRQLLSPQRTGSKTVIILLEDEQVTRARRVINQVTGGLDKPDTGIMFSVPTLFVEGLEAHK